ncbi:MAG: hypothetical protein QXO84_01450 [Candidatus Aenigmatarchaeota archaeon]
MSYKYGKKDIKHHILLNIPYLLVIISIFLSHFVFKGEDLKTFLSFVVLIPIFIYFKWDGRIPIGYALLMLIIASIVLVFLKNESLANQLAIYVYWLFVVGVTCLSVEYIRESKNSKE